MSDDSKNAGKSAQHEEPGDEVEAHGKSARPGAHDEGNDDEVEAHHHTKNAGPEMKNA
jgi:hypothetical protein